MAILKTILVDDNTIVNGFPLGFDETSDLFYILGKPSLPIKLSDDITPDLFTTHTSKRTGNQIPSLKYADFSWFTCVNSKLSETQNKIFEINTSLVEKGYIPGLLLSKPLPDLTRTHLIILISEKQSFTIDSEDKKVKILSTVHHRFDSFDGIICNNHSVVILVPDEYTFTYQFSNTKKSINCTHIPTRIATLTIPNRNSVLNTPDF
jgi:hypothetical protein